MIGRSLARLCRRLASWLEPSPIEQAIRRADDARAIRMEFERQMRPHLTPFQRKLRAGKWSALLTKTGAANAGRAQAGTTETQASIARPFIHY